MTTQQIIALHNAGFTPEQIDSFANVVEPVATPEPVASPEPVATPEPVANMADVIGAINALGESMKAMFQVGNIASANQQTSPAVTGVDILGAIINPMK